MIYNYEFNKIKLSLFLNKIIYEKLNLEYYL